MSTCFLLKIALETQKLQAKSFKTLPTLLLAFLVHLCRHQIYYEQHVVYVMIQLCHGVLFKILMAHFDTEYAKKFQQHVIQCSTMENFHDWSQNFQVHSKPKPEANTDVYIWFRLEDSKSKKAHRRFIWRVKYQEEDYSLQQSIVIVVEQEQKCHRDLESVKTDNLQCVNQENLQCVKLNSVGL